MCGGALLVLVLGLAACGSSGGSSNEEAALPGDADADADGAKAAEDCDDEDASVQTEQPFHLDQDRDGHGAGQPILLCQAAPSSGYALDDTDCDDGNGSISVPIAYYRDRDGDGFGTDPPEPHCQIAIPTGYATTGDDPDDTSAARVPHDVDGDAIANTADSCPETPDDGVDLDADGTDDACDTAIDLTGRVVRGEVLHLAATNAAGASIEYFVEGGELRVEEGGELALAADARLSLRDEALVHLEAENLGGLRPRMTTQTGAEVRSDGTGVFYFNGAELITTGPLRFLELQLVGVYGQGIVENGVYAGKVESSWTGAEVIIERFRGDVALVTHNQVVDLSGVRFLDNQGYPLRCGDESSSFDWPRHGHRTCIDAMRFAEFSGNYFNGPLVAYYDTFEFPDGLRLSSSTRPNRPDALYVHSGLELNGASTIYDVVIRPFRRITARDAEGNVTETAEAYDAPRLRIQDGSVVFSNAELELPLFVRNAEMRFTGSTLRAGIEVFDLAVDEYPYADDWSSLVIEDSAIELGAGSVVPVQEDGPAMFLYARTENMPVTLRGVSLESSSPLGSFYARDHAGYESVNFVDYPEEHDGTAGYLFHNGIFSVDAESALDVGAFPRIFVNHWSDYPDPRLRPLE